MRSKKRSASRCERPPCACLKLCHDELSCRLHQNAEGLLGDDNNLGAVRLLHTRQGGFGSFLHEVVLMVLQEEGIILKNPGSEWKPTNRSVDAWMKLKPEYNNAYEVKLHPAKLDNCGAVVHALRMQLLP